METILTELEQSIKTASTVYLYGAGIIAYGVRCALRKLWQIGIAAHIVSALSEGQRDFQGKPVIALADFPAHLPGALILVATPPEYHAEIAAAIRRQTDCPFLLLGNHAQFALMGEYYRQAFHFRLIEGNRQMTSSSFEVYMARSSRDKTLHGKEQLPPYIHPVQAGAAMDSEHLPDMWHDDDGRNISHRNRDFSEMTVTYWAWQNREADWQGICHYRRILGLPEKRNTAFVVSEADAVLPLPYLCAGAVSFQYSRYVPAADMVLLRSVLTEEERAVLHRELGKTYIYNHNLLIARREVFADYCAHVFSVLWRIEEREKELGQWPRNDRHMGYLAEILTSVYFSSRSGRMQILHAPELWLV